MINDRTLLKLLVINSLISKSNYVIRELAWEIGVAPSLLEELIVELSNNYLINIDNSRVYWNPADNPSTLKPWGWTMIHRAIVGSTQEMARGYGPWSIIVTEYMLLGKGRHGKKWYARLGGLWSTYKILTDPKTASLLPIIVPTILVRIFKNIYGIDVKIKWPNDIIYNGEKIAGILLEAEAFRDQILVYIGIGVNVNNEPPLPGTTSLKKIKGVLTPRNRLLSQIIGWISRTHKLAEEPEEIREQYMSCLETLGKEVVVTTYGGVEVRGIALTVDESGSLIIETKEGVKKKIDSSTAYELRHVE